MDQENPWGSRHPFPSRSSGCLPLAVGSVVPFHRHTLAGRGLVRAPGWYGFALAAFHGVNGLITNDKFCLIRRGRLTLSWWRRPLRLRDPATATYLHEVSVPRGGPYEAVMASAPIAADEPGGGAPVGSGLPAPAALGDANRAGGD